MDLSKLKKFLSVFAVIAGTFVLGLELLYFYPESMSKDTALMRYENDFIVFLPVAGVFLFGTSHRISPNYAETLNIAKYACLICILIIVYIIFASYGFLSALFGGMANFIVAFLTLFITDHLKYIRFSNNSRMD